jgi:hypothetical protein
MEKKHGATAAGSGIVLSIIRKTGAKNKVFASRFWLDLYLLAVVASIASVPYRKSMDCYQKRPEYPSELSANLYP